MMEFTEQIKDFAKRVEMLKDTIQTEEATKTSIVMPFFAQLGYDVFNPNEFSPEFTADVGIKKGEKVDYAILKDGNPIILIEAKWIGSKLMKHDSQLFRYFGTTTAKFAILTNGIEYRFFTDLENKNKMDEKPFLEINILDMRENQIIELKKFHKSTFNVDTILNSASELKYTHEFKTKLAEELQEPSDELVRLFITEVYSGTKTQNVLEKFRPIVKKSLNQYINELMNEKIKNALNAEERSEDNEDEDENETEAKTPETTKTELELYFLVRSLLRDCVRYQDISYKDTLSYFNILYKNNTRKWICRIFSNPKGETLITIPVGSKDNVKQYILANPFEVEKYKDELVRAVSQYKTD